MLHNQQADLSLAWIVPGIAFQQDTGMLFFPNELFVCKMKCRFCGQFIKENISFQTNREFICGNHIWV